MSKSNWKELPDWMKVDDYAFLADAENAEWAWEFLRRNEDYRKHCHQCELLRAAYEYHPPMKDGETEQQWMRRIAYETDSDPIKTRKDLVIANKWGLEGLHDPEQPFSHVVRFIMPGNDFPRFITEPEDLDTFFEVIELGGMDFCRVASEYAVVAVDMTRPLTAQLKVIKEVLSQQQAQLIAAGVLAEAERTAGQARTWLRHLRVLDGLRIGATYKEIAMVLGGKQNEGAKPDDVRKQGEKFVVAARSMMKKGYKSVLTYKGTPYQ